MDEGVIKKRMKDEKGGCAPIILFQKNFVRDCIKAGS
jgi:hypothetical protein